MLIAGLAMASFVATAQNSFSYQSVIRNNGEVVSNQDVALLISILNGSEVCYQEVQKVKTNAYGNISVTVGEGEPKTGSFAAIPWETMQIMMQIEVSTDGTENYVNLGQMQIQPVPYTMYAARTTTVIQPEEASEDPIFEVRDSEGNLMFAVYETGVKVFVDDNKNDDNNSKAAKSKFAVAGLTASKGERNLLTIDAEGTTVFVDDNFNDDDNQSGKAAKSKFAVASLESKGNAELLTIDGSGSTIYVDQDTEGKAAKSKFAVAGHSAKSKKSGNNYTIDNNNSTLYVDFNDNAAKAASQVLSIDGSTATFYVDVDDDQSGKAAKSSFAVAGRSADKSAQTAFVVDGTGTVIYIDDLEGDKAAKSTFAVAGQSTQKGNNNFFLIHRDSTRIYVNDEPTTADTTSTEPGSAPVVAPSLYSAFAVVGMTQKTDMLVVNRDSTIVKMNTYVEEQVQSTTGVVEKVVDDTKPSKVYATGGFKLKWQYPGSPDYTICDSVGYTYYCNEKGNEYLYLMHNLDGYIYEHRNYWLVNDKIYSDTIYLQDYYYSIAKPIFADWRDDFLCLMISRTYDRDKFVTDRKPDDGLFTILESKIRNIGYKVRFEDGVNHYYEPDNEERDVLLTEKNIVTSISDLDMFKNNLTTIVNLLEPSICVTGNGYSIDDVMDIEWEKGYILLDDSVTVKNILKEENGENGIEYYNYDDVLCSVIAQKEDTVFKYKNEQRKYTLAEIDSMFLVLQNGFEVSVLASNGGSVTVSANNETQTGANLQVNCHYADSLIITANHPDENFGFAGWSDGNTENPRKLYVLNKQTISASFIRTTFYVSEDTPDVADTDRDGTPEKPFTKLADAAGIIKSLENINTVENYTIKVRGKLTGSQALGENNTHYSISKNILLIGATAPVAGEEPQDVLDGNGDDFALGIYKINSVTIENLKITGGSENGIFAWGGSSDKKIIGNGTLITGNGTKESTSDGGGIYNCATSVYIEPGAVITGNIAKNGGGITDHPQGSTTLITGGSIKGNIATSGIGNDLYLESYLYIGDWPNNGVITSTDLSGIGDIYFEYHGIYSPYLSLNGNITGITDDNRIKIGLSNYNRDFQINIYSSAINIAEESKKFILTNSYYSINEDGTIKKNELFVNTSTGQEGNTGLSSEEPLPSLAKAFEKMNADNSYTIYLDGENHNIEGPQIVENITAKSITIRGLENGTKLNGNNSGSVLTINTIVPVSIANLTITGGINSDGNGGGLYIGSSSNVTLGNGAIVGEKGSSSAATSSAYANKADKGGGVYVDGGTLTLENGSVVGHNFASGNNAGGVYVTGEGHLYIRDGAKVEYNGSSYYSGGVYIDANAMAEMTGGEISHNDTKAWGGGVRINGSFTMSGGTISENRVTVFENGWGYAGGGVMIEGSGTFNMHGTASIIDNYTEGSQGGAVKVGDGGTFNMTGGTISGNTANPDNSPNGSGYGIRVESSNFYIGDSAYIASNNVVQLIDAHKVNIISPLTKEIAATILPTSYTPGTPALAAADNATLADNAAKFALVQNDESYIENNLIEEYFIDTDGTVEKVNTITVNNQSESTIFGTAMSGQAKRIVAKIGSDFALKPLSSYSNGGNFSGDGRDMIVEVPAGKTLVLTAESPVTLTVSDFSGNFFNVSGTLIIGPNVTISGYQYKLHWHAIEIRNGGNLILNGGTITYSNAYGATRSAIYINNGGMFVMKSGAVKNNTGGVYVEGTFIMNEGEISNNINDDTGGGGVTVNNYGTFIKTGGNVKNNDYTGSCDDCSGAAQMYIYAGGKYGTSADNLTSWSEDQKFEEEF